MSEQTAIKEQSSIGKREVSPEKFRDISISLIPKSLSMHEDKFGQGSDNPQILHRRRIHLEPALDRGGRMIQTARRVNPNFVNPIQEGRTLLYIAKHDEEQKFKVKQSPDKNPIKDQRERTRSTDDRGGGNEMETVDEITKLMWKTNDDWGKMVFIQEDVLVCRSVMAATIPFWDTPLGTVVQNYLTAGIPIEAAIVGLADLAGAGMDGPEQYIKEGNAEFQEVRIGITRAINEAKRNEQGVPVLDSTDQAYVEGEIRKWLDIQIHFAEGRKILLDRDLSSIDDPNVRTAFKEELFTRFDESIKSAKDRAKDLDKKDFAELLTLIGYI